jgi:hypothetical protein
MSKDQLEYWEEKTGIKSPNPCEFLDGVNQAREGIPHRSGMGEEYDRGYGLQKEAEAIADNRYWVTYDKLYPVGQIQ